MLRIACEEGTTTIIATPHNMPGKGCPSRESVERKYNQLKEAAEEAGIDIEILYGTEYFYREEFQELLEEENVITMAGTDRVLIEFDPGTEKKYIRNAVREVLSHGYTPVVAHVERYMKLMEKNYESIIELRKMGALIQVNTGSITGDNGFKTKLDARNLIKAGLVDMLGSDAHSTGRRSPKMKEAAEYVKRKLSTEQATAILTAIALEL